ncbi:MAG TPA: DHH family phosphoesterase [Nitrososphaera sp.]|jgi:RecJ-like exonuclease|nr:DHH family phosphoesterase [Nitrososphaera sp.]
MNDRLTDALNHFCEKLKTNVESGNDLSIITHLDADGITAGSIMAIALKRIGARYSVRAVSDMNSSVIESMKSDGHDFYLITDLGGGWATNLKNAFDNKWLIIDHHQITDDEILTDDDGQILNPWKFGIDGGREVSTGGMAYMVASTLDLKNRNLSAMAVVSALADRQDQGEKRSFLGLNAEILKTAQSLGLVSVDVDIILAGRETHPPHEALAYTPFHYIDGLTWNSKACYLLLKNAGIQLKDNDGRWRVLAAFSQEEKSAIVEAVAKFVGASSDKSFLSDTLIDDLIGYVYTLQREDTRSLLRDGREFSAMLNACGRLAKAGVGIAICMGDRNTALSAGEDIMRAYQMTLRYNISLMFSEKWRFADDGKTVFINGDGIWEEAMLGAVSSLLSGSPSLRGRLLFVRTLAKNGGYKFSSRKCLDSKSQANLGVLMRECSKRLNGTGGGHSAAAGCSIPSSALEDFIACIKAEINDPKFARGTTS